MAIAAVVTRAAPRMKDRPIPNRPSMLIDADADHGGQVGINIVNAASLIERSFLSAFHGFLDTVRRWSP